MRQRMKLTPYKRPSGSWGAARAVAEMLWRKGVIWRGAGAIRRQNKPGEFKCVSCAWAKPAKLHVVEVCESGAKSIAWELTPKRVPLDFFSTHMLSELESWDDHDLESLGRLTHPMRWDASSDKYLPVAWETAFAEIGRELRGQDPKAIGAFCGRQSSIWQPKSESPACSDAGASSLMAPRQAL